jgi:hypothetical protein
MKHLNKLKCVIPAHHVRFATAAALLDAPDLRAAFVLGENPFRP